MSNFAFCFLIFNIHHVQWTLQPHLSARATFAANALVSQARGSETDTRRKSFPCQFLDSLAEADGVDME